MWFDEAWQAQSLAIADMLAAAFGGRRADRQGETE